MIINDTDEQAVMILFSKKIFLSLKYIYSLIFFNSDVFIVFHKIDLKILKTGYDAVISFPTTQRSKYLHANKLTIDADVLQVVPDYTLACQHSS